ncbi:hypothetical protein GH714_011843 [Hevea brasiliensis]|uniref:Pentacotripeptide-repeat region of PRORP domain-containing protein n=1 Tax=Hevea brasiliensis TaxID=3981 RepID=A0A6A6MZN0_HEVBR|nr:hypothetical protein GH714_011843 [Hevea brasiliensis]
MATAQGTKLRPYSFNRPLLWKPPSTTVTATAITTTTTTAAAGATQSRLSVSWLLRLVHSNASQPQPLPQRPPVLLGVRYMQQQQPESFQRLFCSEATDDKEKIRKKAINTKVNFLSPILIRILTMMRTSPVLKLRKKLKRANFLRLTIPSIRSPSSRSPMTPKTFNSSSIRCGPRASSIMPSRCSSFVQDGLTHEALELFSQIKDKGHMPDVVAHTAVVEAYANAGQSKEALKALAADGKLADANKYILEMMSKGMRPNAATYAAVFEAYAKEQKEDQAREFLQQMKQKGFVPDEKAVREVLDKRGQVFRTVINILFNK